MTVRRDPAPPRRGGGSHLAGGLSADVEDVGTVGEQVAAVGDRRGASQRPPSEKGVRRDVDDAHEHRVVTGVLAMG